MFNYLKYYVNDMCAYKDLLARLITLYGLSVENVKEIIYDFEGDSDMWKFLDIIEPEIISDLCEKDNDGNFIHRHFFESMIERHENKKNVRFLARISEPIL